MLELALHGMPIDEAPKASSANQIAVNDNQKLFLITAQLEERNGKLFSKDVTEL